MKKVMTLFVLTAIAAAMVASDASAVVRPYTFDFGFEYLWMRDDDGDGIPNGQDLDWFPPLDGTGYQLRNGAALNRAPGSDGKAWNGDIIRNRFQKRTGDCNQDCYKYRYRYVNGNGS